MLRVSIFQVDPEADIDNIAPHSCEEFLSLMDMDNIDSNINKAIYDMVYNKNVDAVDLDDVYRIFTEDPPEDYEGRPLSPSDYLSIEDKNTRIERYYYLDTDGFKEIFDDPDNDPSEKEQRIKVVYVEPGSPARVIEIDNILEAMQEIVFGDIDTIYPFEERVCLVCNGAGKYNGMPFNRAVYDENGDLLDIIAGPFFLCGEKGYRFCSLDQEQLEKYVSLYNDPKCM